MCQPRLHLPLDGVGTVIKNVDKPLKSADKHGNGGAAG